MTITFSASGINYSVTEKDIFMDNGAAIMYIKNGKFADPSARRVILPNKEWQRIKSSLVEIDYENYFGRKPLMNDVSVYQIN